MRLDRVRQVTANSETSEIHPSGTIVDANDRGPTDGCIASGSDVVPPIRLEKKDSKR